MTRVVSHRPIAPVGFIIFRGVAAFGLVSGIIVLASALLLRKRPKENTT